LHSIRRYKESINCSLLWRPHVFRSTDHARSPDHRIFLVPLPPFFNFCCKQSTSAIRPLGLPCATLGWPLGGPRVAQGPPKPNPKPKQAEGRKLPKNTKRNGISVARWGSALAKYQLLSTELLFLRHSKAEWLWKSREIRGVCVGLERPRVCPRHQNKKS